MKRKIVLTIMPFLLTAIFILGCGHRIEIKDEALEGMSGEKINTTSENIVKIYYPTADASQILSKDITNEVIDENFVLKSLIEASVLPDSVEINDISLTTKENVKTITANFNKNFIDYLNTLSYPAEFATLTAISNTYLDFFNGDRFVIRVNNKEVRTNNKVYSAYFSKYEDVENPEFGKFTTQVVKNTTNEITKASMLLETAKSETNNVIISPVMLKLSLLNIYNGVSDENKSQIAAYIEDIDNTEKAVQDFASKEKDNLNNLLIYHLSKTDEFKFEESFLNAINPYNTVSQAIDFTKSTATKDINDYINNFTFDKKLNYFDKIDKNSSMYDFTSFNLNKNLKLTFESKENDVFYNGDNKESTVSYLTGVQKIPFFETDEIKGIIENYEEDGLSLILIQPKQVNINYTNIDFASILDYYNLEEKNVSIKIPEFEIDSALSLNKNMKSLGVNDIFDFGKANFEKMFTENTQYFLSDLLQYNKLTFTGTVKEQEGKLEPEKEFLLDKPFVFVVYNNLLDEVVYMGQVNNIASVE